MITGCLLDYSYFKNNDKLIAVNLNKQRPLDAYSKTLQQIVFQGVAVVKIKRSSA